MNEISSLWYVVCSLLIICIAIIANDKNNEDKKGGKR